jgi:hypothetical protein
MEQNYEKSNENAIEFLSGEQYVTVTFSNRKHISRIKKLYSERKDEFKYFIENKDGTVCAKLPLKWVKINAGALPGSTKKREMSEEQKAEFAKRIKAIRESNK